MELIVFNEEPRIRDLQLAHRLEMARPRNIRKVIEENLAELERHGATHVERASPITGGHKATEYWLNESQAILICMKSKAPKAEDARAEIIDVFKAWRHGKLAPTSSGVTIEAIGTMFDAKLTPVHQEIAAIKGNVTFLARRIDDIVPRREFPEEVKKQWRHVLARRYAGECPCCREIQIIDTNGSAIPGRVHYDHYRGRELNGPSDGWPVCPKCNSKLREAEFKNSSRSRFDVFHDDRRNIYAGHAPKMIQKSDPAQGVLL